jgi:protein-L-isoaspartate(D-aspartate) O-methyltransferase
MDAAGLRDRMVTTLVEDGVVDDAGVERAMRQVPRHRFTPDASPDEAYADHAVVVGRGRDGTPISTASQPRMVAIMLGQLEVAAGHRVLEIGTGSGYNAALLSALAGPEGHVVSVELEPALAERAAAVLAEVGAGDVEVVTGDGRLGHGEGAPYDRIMVTTGAKEVAPAWRDQLVDGGRIVVPVVDDTGRGWTITHQRAGDDLVVLARTPSAFLPIRDRPDR